VAVDPTRISGDPQLRVAGVRVHTLFEQHSRMVYGLCRALLRNPHDAEDATQATYVSAYTALLGGTSPREPAAWLATIARNECAGRARARMREPLPLLDAEIADAQGPEAELERKARVTELQEAIADLPEKQREAVVLRDLYGLHYSEVGAALGMSVASVESLLFRARRRRRVSLKPLASGALTVPVAVQEGVAQAIPSFAAAGAAGGGATSGAVGVGLLAKLFAGPAAVKIAVGVAGAVAAGSIAVAGAEHADRVRLHAPKHASAVPTAAPEATAEAAFVGVPAGPAAGANPRGEDSTSGGSGKVGGPDSSGSGDTSDGSAEGHPGGTTVASDIRSGDDGHGRDDGTTAGTGVDRSGRETGASSTHGDERAGSDPSGPGGGHSISSGGKGEDGAPHALGAPATERGGLDAVTSTAGESGTGSGHTGESGTGGEPEGGATVSGDSGHGDSSGHGADSGHGGGDADPPPVG
jgi:RNA polymerase sigma factor (sigma-70 family)